MATKLQQISELSQLLRDKSAVYNDLCSLLDVCHIEKSLKKLNMEKQKGESSLNLLKFLLVFRLCGMKIFTSYKQNFGGFTSGGKNQFYRFLERPNMDWRRLLISVAKAFRNIIKSKAEDTDYLYAIIDDTTIEKTGWKIEGITKVFCHVKMTFVLGFKMLTLAISDGKTTIPFDFSYHSEKRKDNSGGLTKKQLRNRRSVKRDDSDCNKKRKAELKQKKTVVAIQMLKRMVKHGIKPQYLLIDKWFCNASFIAEVRKIGHEMMHVITLLRNKKVKFKVSDKTISAQTLCKENKHKMHRCRQYKCRYFVVDAVLNNMVVRLFVVKMGKSDYEVMLTTDTALTFKQAFEHYQHRWSIEVMFKECKQYLGLGRCQSTNHNVQIADTTLVLIGYTIMSLKKRFSDYESFGELFHFVEKDLLGHTFIERWLPMIVQLLNTIAEQNNFNWLDHLKQALNSEQQNGLLSFSQNNQQVKEHKTGTFD